MSSIISIIIPAHNEENYLSQTLDSLKRQTLKDYEVIIVANGCTDNTLRIAEESAQADSQIKVFSLKGANVSRARNYGASKAKGHLLVFLDADTLLEPDTLERIDQDFTAGYAVATTKVRPDLKELKYNFSMRLKNIYNSMGIYHGCSGILICRREDFDQVNGYDPELTVREHHKLTVKLKSLGNYTCLDAYVITSMRRLNQWGLTKSALFWAEQFAKDKMGKLKSTEYEKVR